MKIRLVKPWGLWSVGTVFTDMPKVQRDMLIESGHAVVDEVAPVKFREKLRLRRSKHGD